MHKKFLTLSLATSLLLSFLTGCSQQAKDNFNNSINDFINGFTAEDPGIDPFVYVNAEFEGIAPFAHGEVKGTPQRLSEHLVVNYDLDKKTCLKNGDVVNLYCQYDESVAQRDKITIAVRNKPIEVTGLNQSYLLSLEDLPEDVWQEIQECCNNHVRVLFTTKLYRKFFAALIDGNSEQNVKYGNVIIENFDYDLKSVCYQLKNEADSWTELDLSKLILTYKVDLTVKDSETSDPYDISIYMGCGFSNIIFTDGVPDIRIDNIQEYGANFLLEDYKADVIGQFSETYKIEEKEF